VIVYFESQLYGVFLCRFSIEADYDGHLQRQSVVFGPRGSDVGRAVPSHRIAQRHRSTEFRSVPVGLLRHQLGLSHARTFLRAQFQVPIAGWNLLTWR